MAARLSKRPTLEPSRKRIERAKKHVDDLKVDIEQSGKKKEHGVISKYDANVNLQTLTAHLPFDVQLRWGVVVGDVLHNLRSALDNLVWQLVLANNKNPDALKNSFPIFSDVTKYGSNVGTCLVGVRRDAQTHIEGLQPYHSRQDPESEPLWLLHELNNRDKHRVPNFSLLYLASYAFPLSSTEAFALSVELVKSGLLRKGPFEDGAEVLQFTPPTHMEMDITPTSLIAFEISGPAKGYPVLELLDRLTVLLDQTVNDFAIYFP